VQHVRQGVEGSVPQCLVPEQDVDETIDGGGRSAHGEHGGQSPEGQPDPDDGDQAEGVDEVGPCVTVPPPDDGDPGDELAGDDARLEGDQPRWRHPSAYQGDGDEGGALCYQGGDQAKAGRDRMMMRVRRGRGQDSLEQRGEAQQNVGTRGHHFAVLGARRASDAHRR
jgi:hypothetical protein